MPDSRPKAVEHGAALGVNVEIVTKDPKVKGFSVVKRRSIVERTPGWLMHHRRNYPIWRCDLNRITLKLREPAVLLGCGLRPPKFEHRNGADSSSLACVLGKAWVAPRLLSVDAVAFSAGQFADGHLVGLGSAFDTAVTGGGQVVVPVRVGGCSTLGCEDVDDVRLGVVREVHRWGDVLPPTFAAAVVQQDPPSALEVPADPALVRSELRDGVRVPVEPLGHVELQSFTISGRRRSLDDLFQGVLVIVGDEGPGGWLPGVVVVPDRNGQGEDAL